MDIVRKTIERDEEYLRQISKPVSFENDDYKKDIELIKEYCLKTELYALASVQIGIPKRIVFLKNTTLDVGIDNLDYSESKVLINPVIISRRGVTKYWEGCYSCLDYIGLVRRPYKMVVEYYDINGVKQKEKFEGFEATVLSHELDHLDGILHMDIADEVLEMPRDKRITYRKEHPYEIISKTGEYKRS